MKYISIDDFSKMNLTKQTAVNSDPRRVINIVEQFLKGMREHEISFVYEGEITQQITLAFSALAESSISKSEDTGLIQRRVNFVMVECLQNITKHTEDIKTNNPSLSSKSIFMISKSKSEYAITTGNTIDKSKSHSLQVKIDYVNSLNKEELNEIYKKQISEGELSEVGGAGLGFIDILRRTGRKLEYHFLEIDEQTSFFILTSFVSRS